MITRPTMHSLAVATLLLLATPSAWPADRAYNGEAFERRPSVPALVDIGRQLFADPSLSASGQLACASCHDPARHYGPPDQQVVRLGGRSGKEPGRRTVPALTYLQAVPPFSEHFNDDDGDDGKDQGPAGGRDWDGRADSAHEQARGPLLSPFEMANASEGQVVAAVRRAPYAAAMRAAFGKQLFDDEATAFRAVLLALEVFQQEPARFYPYSSKYDAWLRGQVQLAADEQRGMAVFNDPQKGNCARCHNSGVRNGAFPAFSDFGLVALGLPRNPAIAANRDARYFDLGLCGPLREDLTSRSEYCGLFRTPSLRNVAERPLFFHNGAAGSLRDAVRFYVERDTQPERWYPTNAGGSVQRFDDLPAAYWSNLDQEPPFGQQAGEAPRLSEQEIDDVVAFLKTLTDGYAPVATAALSP
jgi:cytochrome c peroxidase